MKNRYDVIIIGAGISGLIAGAYLAKNNLKVLIAEKNNNVGGCCSSFRQSGFIFDAGAQIIGSCHSLNGLGSILNTLNIDLNFLRLKPTDVIHYPEEVIKVDSNLDDFKVYLKKRFKKEKNNIEKFFNLLLLAEDKSNMSYIMEKYASMTYEELLEQFFGDKILKSILSAQCGYLGLPPNQLSAVATIFLLKTYLIDGAYYPKGGMQILSNAIADAFNKFGGTLFLSSEIKEILIKNNIVEGVLIKEEKFFSNFIISSSDMLRTYKKLINPLKTTINEEFYKKLNNFKIGDSGCIAYLGISKKIELENKNGWYYSSYDINSSFKEVTYVHIPTNFDKCLSKNGDNILVATSYFNYSNDIHINRQAFKAKLMNEFLSKLEKHIKGISKNIITSDIATPLTVERYTFNSKGSLYGWEQSPGQAYKNSFPINSPINGLFHAGHWTFPGGGVVAVAVSGFNVAKRVLKKYTRFTITKGGN